MKTSIPLRGVAIVCACIIATAALLGGIWPLEEVKSSVDESTKEDLSDAEELSKKAEELGNRLIKILADEKQLPGSRAKAARILSKLKFAPAIPVLVNNIRLSDPSVESIPGKEGNPLVCLLALQAFGNAAVPQIVDAYLDECDPIENLSRNEDIKRRLLLAAIGGGRTSRVAMTHYAGFSARKDKRITPAKTKEWNDYLDGSQ